MSKALQIRRKRTIVSMVFAVSGRDSTAVYCVLSVTKALPIGRVFAVSGSVSVAWPAPPGPQPDLVEED